MAYRTAMHTSQGSRGHANQDSLLIKTAIWRQKEIVLAVLCDGMGGLNNGEHASGRLVHALSSWMEREMPPLVRKRKRMAAIRKSMKKLISRINTELLREGSDRKAAMGSTLVIFLAIGDEFVCVSCGDSRAYITLPDGTPRQITTDQSTGGHILISCIGAKKEYTLQEIPGQVNELKNVLLASDGFYRRMTWEEQQKILMPAYQSREQMKRTMVGQTNQVRQRGETDDCSAILISFSGTGDARTRGRFDSRKGNAGDFPGSDFESADDRTGVIPKEVYG